MPQSDLRLALRIRADLSDAVKQLRGLRSATERQGRTARGAKASTDRLAGSIQRLGDRAGGTLRRMVAVGATFGALNVAIRRTIGATIRQEQALAQVEARLRSTSSSKAAEEVLRLAHAMQQVTAYGDEAVLEMQGVLLSFTALHDILGPATEIVLDMSTALGRDLTSTAIQVGKALQDPVGQASALRESGVNLTRAMQEQIRVLVESGRLHEAQAVILRELQVEFEGSARAARDTLGGALQALSNAFGDLLEAEGTGGLREAVESLVATLRDPEVKAGVQFFVGHMLKLFEGAAEHGAQLVSVLAAIGGVKAAKGVLSATGALGAASASALRGPAAAAAAGSLAFAGVQASQIPGAVRDRRRLTGETADSRAEAVRLRRLRALLESADAGLLALLDASGDRRTEALDRYVAELRSANAGVSAAANERLAALGIAPLERRFELDAPPPAAAAPGAPAEAVPAAEALAAAAERRKALLDELAAAREELRRGDLSASQREREDVLRTAQARLDALDRTVGGWREAAAEITAVAGAQYDRLDALDEAAAAEAAARRRGAHDAAVRALVDPYERARIEIREWLEATLAALDEADEAYAGHAGRARAIAAERLAGVDERERADADASGRGLASGARQALGDIADRARDGGTQIYSAIDGAFSRAGNAVAAFAAGAKLEIGSLVESVLADLARIAVQRAILGPLADALGGLFGGGSAAAGVNHAGGIAGALGGRRRQVPALAFAGAPRLHRGGIAGLRSDEVPAILQRGEAVLPRGARAAPGRVTVNLVNRGTPQRVESAGQRIDPRGLVVDVVVEDLARRGPISRHMEAAGMGAAR